MRQFRQRPVAEERDRRHQETGAIHTAESVEVDREAVVMGITMAGQAGGARSAPAELVLQVFTANDGEIVEIRSFPERPRALART